MCIFYTKFLKLKERKGGREKEQGKQKGRDQDIGDKAEGMGQDMPVYKAIQGGSLGWRGEAPNLNFLVPSILVPYCCCFPALVA